MSNREYVLPILCYERARPEAGFITDRGPRENPYPNRIRLTGLPASEEREYRVALTDGARYGGTVPTFNAVGGVMSATTTVTLNESELGTDLRGELHRADGATAALATVRQPGTASACSCTSR